MSNSCFYCGDDSQTLQRDHVIPSSFAETSCSYDQRKTVSCCRECNITLSNRPYHTLEERSAFLLERYQSKYRKALKVPHRTEDELKEYGPRMRSTIKSSLIQKEWVTARLQHLSRSAVGYFSSDVSHLKGNVTLDKSVAYRLILDFLRHEGAVTSFVAEAAAKTGKDKKYINAIFSEREHIDVSLGLKLDRNYPLEISLNKLRQSLNSNRRR